MEQFRVQKKNPYLLFLLLVLLAKAIWAIWFIVYGQIHLVPDEAQYWLWSKHLDWGYYSKPPGIALQIALGTQFFGDTELGVRFGAVIVSILTSLGVYFLSRSCGLSEKMSFWAACVMALSPMGMMGSIYATTDWGLILFWVLASICLARAVHLKQQPNYFILGLCILGGALFKWTMYIIWVPILGYAFYEKQWFSKQIIWAILISLLGFLPSIIWNVSHDWVTFRHVWTQSTGGEVSTKWDGNPISFIGAQVALLSPVYFALLCGACITIFRKKSEADRSVKFCGILCLAIVLVYFCLSFFHKMQGNWAIYAYPTGLVALSWYAYTALSHGTRWLVIGTVVSLLFFITALAIPYVQSYGLLAHHPIPFKMNPFRANLGWDNLPGVLKQAGYDPSQNFLVADKYQTSSLLSFYSQAQKRAYFLNLFGRRNNQFSFWPDLSQEQKGKNGFFVVIEDQVRPKTQQDKIQETYQEKLVPYFSNVRLIGVYPLFYSYGEGVKWAMVFLGTNYNGRLPEKTDIY